MTYYYVTHPNLGISATVTAPTTEKARTTFLDYLERAGKIRRAHRGYLRENMVAEKISSPESVMSDVQLDYRYQETYGPTFRLGEEGIAEAEDLEEFGREPEHIERQRLQEERAEIEQLRERWPSEEEEQQPRPRMPIQELATRGFAQ